MVYLFHDFLPNCVLSENNPYPPQLHGGLLEGILKDQMFLKGSMIQNWNFLRNGVGFKPKIFYGRGKDISCN